MAMSPIQWPCPCTMAMSTYNGHVIVEWLCLRMMAMYPYDDHVIIVEWTWAYSENSCGAARIPESVRAPYSTGDCAWIDWKLEETLTLHNPLCLQLWLSPQVYIF